MESADSFTNDGQSENSNGFLSGFRHIKKLPIFTLVAIYLVTFLDAVLLSSVGKIGLD